MDILGQCIGMIILSTGNSMPSERTPWRGMWVERKLAETQSTKEAMRALKRRISDAVYTRLQADASR